MKIREVNWDDFDHAGSTKVASLLKNLASRKLPRAMKASHQLWTALCGGGKVYSAAIPCVPFLVEIMSISDDAVKDGIIDVFQRMLTEGGEYKEAVVEQKSALYRYTKAKDPITAAKVKDLIAAL